MLRQSSGGTSPQKIKILITGKLHDVALDLLTHPPAELALNLPTEIAYHPDCTREQLLSQIVDADVLVSRSETDVDKEVLLTGKQLSVVARAAVGYGNIDVEAATEAGVLVLNTPGKNTNSAAELTLGLLLSVIRNIPRAHASTSAGGWNRHEFTGTELLEKTIGIVGLGNVGHRVAKFCRSFDMRVLAYDPYISEEVFRRHGAERRATLEEMLAECDVLTVHTPLNKETKGMVGEIELRKMKKGAVVLNAARGGIINEKALLKLLNEGYVAGAGIDTFDNEPKPLPELVGHRNVVVTPHIGASTHEAQFRIGQTVAIQTLKALRGEIVDTPVNLPHVSILGTEASRKFAVLAEKVGRVAAQICDFNPRLLKLMVNADLKSEELQLLRLSAVKGFVSPSSDEYVSYVNAERLLSRRGLELQVEFAATDGAVRRNGLELRVEGSAAHEQTSVGAVLFGNEHPRLCSINDFLFEIEPDGEMLVLQNHDRPGVIGDIGSYLARNQINIAQFELSRNRRGGMAMSLIRIDGTLEQELLTGMRKLPNVIGVKMVSGL
ncbi:MAG: phosphoglycerate dehydrogenase [Silvanigrellaceae bacterium]